MYGEVGVGGRRRGRCQLREWVAKLCVFLFMSLLEPFPVSELAGCFLFGPNLASFAVIQGARSVEMRACWQNLASAIKML